MSTVPRFDAPAWLRGGHAQTIAGVVLRPTRDIFRRRERLETPDADFVDLDWFTFESGANAGEAARTAGEPAAPLVLLLHGLEGSTQSAYIGVIARELAVRGIENVGLNFRSCSGEVIRGARSYHAGDYGDVVWVLEQLAARHPGRPLGAVGFSIGGNILLRWFGEARERASQLVRAAAVVSVPFDLEAGARFMESSASRLYLRHLLPSLRVKIAAKRAQLAEHIDVERALAARTFFEFDEVATAPLHGFSGVLDYYARASSSIWIPGVRVPTLVVHALDDPFLPPSAVPQDAIAANPSLTAAISPHGGHIGFVHGIPWAPRFFAEEIAAEYLARALGDRSGA